MTGLGKLLRALHKSAVEFIIVGGFAARAHGSARITQDIDISYARTAENIKRVHEALTPFRPYLRGAPVGLPFEWSVETIRAGLNFTLTTTSGDINLLGDIVGGGGYEDMVLHTISAPIFGVETKILNLPWLLKVKRAAGRPKDLEVIAELEVIRDEMSRMVD